MVSPLYSLREIKQYMKKRKRGVTGNDVKPRWEEDYDLLENEGLFAEYLEMGKRFYLSHVITIIANMAGEFSFVLYPR